MNKSPAEVPAAGARGVTLPPGLRHGRAQASGAAPLSPVCRPLVGAAVVCALLACAPSAVDDGPADPPAPGTEEVASSDVAKQDRVPPTLGPRPFWHDGDLATALALSEAQISIMETRRQAALDGVRTERQAATELRNELSDLLARGAWDEARRLAGRLAQASAAGVEADVELKVGILEMLTPEQRKRLVQESPGALRRSWLSPGGSRGSRGGQNPLLER